MNTQSLNDFKKGMRVRYSQPFCGIEYGCVSSVNDRYVFVKFDIYYLCMTTGDEDYTAQACTPESLTVI